MIATDLASRGLDTTMVSFFWMEDGGGELQIEMYCTTSWDYKSSSNGLTLYLYDEKCTYI